MAQATVSTNMRIPADLHEQMTARKQQVGISINDQIIVALSRYEQVERERDDLRQKLEAEQLAHHRALAQVELLTRLLAEQSGQQVQQLAEAYKDALRDVAMMTARAVRRELRGPGAHAQQSVNRRRVVRSVVGLRRGGARR